MNRKRSEEKEMVLDDPGFSLSRRRFLQGLGGGLFVLFSYNVLPAQERRPPGAQALPSDFNAFLRIAPEGKVTGYTGKIEMGQGVVTSLAQILAEELDVPLNSVDMIMGDTDLCPWDMGTFGSRSIRFFGPPLREAAAEARALLIQLASEHLGLGPERLIVRNGLVQDRDNPQKQVSYGRLAQGKIIERHLTPKPAPKPISQYRMVGKSSLRKDGVLKITGKAQYAGDVHPPNMLYASILRPPAHGAKLKSLDPSGIEKDQEVKLVRDGDLIAVLHPYPDGAEKALSRIKAEWDVPQIDLNPKTIYPHLLRVAPRGVVVTEGGDLGEGERLSQTTYEGTYYDHYMAHAPMETHTALAKPEGDRMVVWVSTQRPFGAKDEVAQALSLSPEKVRVITPFVGGGFGGKTFNKQAVEAARLAKLTGQPVQVAWSRKEEFFYDTFRPAAIAKVGSGADKEGRITWWTFDAYFSGPRGVEQLYATPHHRELFHGHYTGIPGAHPFRTGAWRAPGANFNVFARECHMDTMAAKLGWDPVKFRLRNLSQKRRQRVLLTAAEKFGWEKRVKGRGRGFGVAFAEDAGAYVAAIGEVEIDRSSGRVQVKRIVYVQDMGVVINPAGATTQMEGGLTMGLGQALTEEVRFKGGQILDINFDTYEIPRFSWLPEIETVLVDNPEVPPQGGGEPSIVVVAALIGNAIFNATGARLYELPMNRERVKEALTRAGIK
ncbi:MAG: xanthine dehydrogenase family protein molybdopterin-binding subunit [Deltaproteobacteria bacterium]|nr:xanthine dehydrogenase family protein molybdopterin-binding subunit [Deltaproteobacteria bacterium]